MSVKNVDFCITHFLRVERLQELLQSIKFYYPEANITVACQGAIPEIPEIEGCTAILTPFDSGLSYNRNILVKNTERPFFLLLEDDFVFTEKTLLEPFLNVLGQDKDIGVVGGLVLENGYPVRFEHLLELDEKERVLYHRPDGNKWQFTGDTRFKYTDSCINFALFRRELFQDCLWDPGQKLAEHNDFYLRLKDTKWKVASTEDTELYTNKHDGTEYKAFKRRPEFRMRLLRKHNLKKIVYQNGYTMTMKNDKLLTGKNL